MENSELRAQRVAGNEALGREINERIEAGGGGAPGTMSVVCECGDGDCRTRLEIGSEQYRKVRQHPGRFIVAVGHEVLDFERVIAREGEWLIAEKVGEARRVVEEAEDPSAEADDGKGD